MKQLLSLSSRTPTSSARKAGKRVSVPQAAGEHEKENVRPAPNRPAAEPSDGVEKKRKRRCQSEVLGEGPQESGAFYTMPPLAWLRRASAAELRAVEGLEVGRVDVGSVKFVEPVDLRGVPSTSG